MTGAEIIGRARAAAAAKEAGSTKIRMSRELYDRACACAKDVGEPVGRWMRLCTLDANSSKPLNVAIPEELTLATRGSVVATLNGTHADKAETRRRIAAGVLRCEASRPPPPARELREGTDYLLEGVDYPLHALAHLFQPSTNRRAAKPRTERPNNRQNRQGRSKHR